MVRRKQRSAPLRPTLSRARACAFSTPTTGPLRRRRPPPPALARRGAPPRPRRELLSGRVPFGPRRRRRQGPPRRRPLPLATPPPGLEGGALGRGGVRPAAGAVAAGPGRRLGGAEGQLRGRRKRRRSSSGGGSKRRGRRAALGRSRRARRRRPPLSSRRRAPARLLPPPAAPRGGASGVRGERGSCVCVLYHGADGLGRRRGSAVAAEAF